MWLCFGFSSVALENRLAIAVAPPNAKGAESPSESELKAVAKYKAVIREQDEQIQHLRQRLAALEGQHIAAQVRSSANLALFARSRAPATWTVLHNWRIKWTGNGVTNGEYS